MSDEPTLLVVCGSRREPSRTRELARHAVASGRETAFDVEILDLRDYPMELFDGRGVGEYDDATTEAVSRFLDADAYLVASPVYFGGMSGALKNLVDHVPYETFQERSRAAGILVNGRDRRHHFVVETQIRATLVYLGVDVATPSVFATEADFDGFTLTDPALDSYIDAVVEETVALARR